MIEILYFLLCFVLVLIGVGAAACFGVVIFVLMEKFFNFLVAHPKIEDILGILTTVVFVGGLTFFLVGAALLLCKNLPF